MKHNKQSYEWFKKQRINKLIQLIFCSWHSLLGSAFVHRFILIHEGSGWIKSIPPHVFPLKYLVYYVINLAINYDQTVAPVMTRTAPAHNDEAAP